MRYISPRIFESVVRQYTFSRLVLRLSKRFICLSGIATHESIENASERLKMALNRMFWLISTTFTTRNLSVSEKKLFGRGFESLQVHNYDSLGRTCLRMLLCVGQITTTRKCTAEIESIQNGPDWIRQQWKVRH